jgi:hypothetical protein
MGTFMGVSDQGLRLQHLPAAAAAAAAVAARYIEQVLRLWHPPAGDFSTHGQHERHEARQGCDDRCVVNIVWGTLCGEHSNRLLPCARSRHSQILSHVVLAAYSDSARRNLAEKMVHEKIAL